MDNRTSIKKTTQGVSDTKVQSTNKSMNILEQFPNATGVKTNADGSTTIEINQPKNRAERRAMEKRNKKLQKKQQKMIMDYIKRHPEAVKVELDEEKIEELENEEANLTNEVNNEDDVMTSGYIHVGEVQPFDSSQVETISSNDRGHRIDMNPIDEACDFDSCGLVDSDLIKDEKKSTTTNFTPVVKTNVVKK